MYDHVCAGGRAPRLFPILRGGTTYARVSTQVCPWTGKPDALHTILGWAPVNRSSQRSLLCHRCTWVFLRQGVAGCV